MDIVTKEAVATVAPVESENPNGEFVLILSDNSLDRDDENLEPEDWQLPLPDQINFDTDHSMSVEKTAGSANPSIVGNELLCRGSYAGTPHGQLTRQLVKEGHITQASVAYRVLKNGKRELLNGSFVAVPANPNARILSSKAAKTDAETAADAAEPGDTLEDAMPPHDALVQAIHDAACHLGADCADTGMKGIPSGALQEVARQWLGEGFFTSKAADKPYGNVAYADPANGKYPIDTEEHARAAWSYIHQAKNRTGYTAEQLSAIEGRIRAACDKFGIETSDKSVGSPLTPDTAPAATLAEKSATVPAAAPSADEVALRSRAYLMSKTIGKEHSGV